MVSKIIKSKKKRPLSGLKTQKKQKISHSIINVALVRVIVEEVIENNLPQWFAF